ncbi:alpha/beta fold hydrolase [Clostridium paridis]|uniref:Alpha/beta hydrolase n=1 Tax=Clostridium paridis TaxID=2803863 RepID=A0A937FHR9_9CLOT|nr:alpha/beta hydrolase [Clostridium paridis]MBL4932242.1 alpha/beta hydrolase [Clostridium paridis]
MDRLRRYGVNPYNIAVIHGGPGAPGEVAPIAKELSDEYGILEPFQTEESIDRQILELKNILDKNASFPITLIGHSWGAWLSYIFAAKYPKLVKKLIIIGSGCYEAKYLSIMNDKRVNRLTKEENVKVESLFKTLNDINSKDKKEVLEEFGKLMSKSDSFSPIVIENEAIDFYPEVFKKCMDDINNIRNNGELLNMGYRIKCPVVAIHGEYDSHPYEGVKEPLSKVIEDFKFILLDKCGHSPWNETFAKGKFYEIIRREI